jgi:predicted PurR-regulated permease PerM
VFGKKNLKSGLSSVHLGSHDLDGTVAAGTSSGESGRLVLPPPKAVVDPITPADAAPEWLFPIIKKTINRIVLVGLLVALGIWALGQVRSLASILFFAFFLALAMTPAITWLHVKRGWSRGLSAGALILAVLAILLAFVGLLIPMTITMSSRLSKLLPQWANQIDSHFHTHLGNFLKDNTAITGSIVRLFKGFGVGDVLHIASSGVAMVFNVFTLLMFTLLFAVGLPGMQRAVFRRLKPSMQVRVGWAWDSAIQQTGGYFYSRLLLLVINGTLFLFVMILVGVPWYFAVPLSYFQAFFAEFIPVVGTYIGIAIPVVLVLGLNGWVQALIVLAWAIIYQQIENYWLSPRFASSSMDINAGLAFGAALFGGAVGGAIGAVVAMPVAGMITAFIKHFARQYPIAYESIYDTTLIKSEADDDSDNTPSDDKPSGTESSRTESSDSSNPEAQN